MPQTFNILLIATMALYVVTPLYTAIRGRIQRKIVDHDQPIKFYSRRRILRIVSINILLLLAAMVIIMTVIQAIKAESGTSLWQASEVQILWAVCFACFVVCYGSGAYIASIVSEEYTLNRLEKLQEFRVLNLSVKLFHGPISHVMIFSGGLVVLWLIAIFELSLELTDRSASVTVQYFLLGLAFGVMYAVAQIRNLTWKDQLPWMSLVSAVFLVAITLSGVLIYNFPMLMFNLGNTFSLLLVLLLKLSQFKLFHGKYAYDFTQLLDPNK